MCPVGHCYILKRHILDQQISIPVHKGMTTVFLDPTVKGDFLPDYLIQIAKAFQMFFANTGDQSHVRFCHSAEDFDFAGMVGAQLDDGKSGSGTNAQKGQGDAQVVVVIAWRGVANIMLR